MKLSKRNSYTLFFIIAFQILGISQQEDPTLFSINSNPVKVSEFLYIYGKNNGKEADYSKKSLEEYLALYKKFKLKVAKAKMMRLDTLQELKEELHMYQQQVSNSYIMDKEVTDQLIREIYARQKKDILVKHIFFQFPPNNPPQDTQATYLRAMKAYEALQNGVPFGKVVQENSDDRTNINHSGDLGYVTAILPDGFYEIENTIYQLPIGGISRPVKSNSGYHILRVDDIRPARREIEIAQILIKKPTERPQDQNNKVTALKVYSMIQSGADFNQMVQTFSDDAATKAKDGYIGFVGINQFEKDFEDSVFALQKDGAISAPIESRLGWHIIKRISVKEELPYPQAKEKIKIQLESDSRYQYARNRVLERIKSLNGFMMNEANIQKFISALPPEFTSFSWEVSPDLPDVELFRLGNSVFRSMTFAHYLKNNTEERLQYANGTAPALVIPAILNKYINEKVIEFEQSHLSEAYPEFKNLMREYEEGILLFEITRQSVWDKASTDTIGLKAFYEKNKTNYKWNERALVNEIFIKSTDELVIKPIYEYVRNNSIEKTIKKFNKKNPELVSYEKDYVEKESEDMKSLSWIANYITPYSSDQEKGVTTWKKIAKILPLSQKTLEESRGYVIADYQDYLEKEWIAQLEKEIKIEVDQQVFNQLIKK